MKKEFYNSYRFELKYGNADILEKFIQNFIKKYVDVVRVGIIAFRNEKISSSIFKTAIQCMSTNGVKTYVLEKKCPRQELLFGIYEKNCDFGIFLTASERNEDAFEITVYCDEKPSGVEQL